MLRTNSLALVIAITTLAVQYVSAASCGVIENDTDFQGNDLANAPASSAQDCCPICDANPSCTGFAFGWGVCYLKYGTLTRISKVGVSAGAMAPTSSCGVIENDTDFQGNDLANAPASSANACCPICNANPSCSGFAFAHGSCYLKYGPLVRITKVGVSTGVAQASTSQCAPVEPNVDYFGNDLECNPSIVTPDACCAKCTANSQCQLYVVSRYGCCIKFAPGARQVNLDPSLNAFAAFRSPPATTLKVVDATSSPDIRVDPISYSYVAGAQWFPTAPQVITTLLDNLNTTLSRQVHGAEPEQLMVVVEAGTNTIMPFTSVTSLGECAALVGAHGETFFTYLSDYGICLGHQFLGSSSKALLRRGAALAPSAPVLSVAKAIPVDFALPPAMPGADDRACVSACQASSTSRVCAAATRSSTTCAFFGPLAARSPTSIAGWLTSAFVATVKPNLPVFSSPTKVHIYTTAHQDDHELFMSNTFHYSIADAATKVVFVYTTAGDDKDALDSWRIARERGTLAVSTAWVDNLGKFNSNTKTETVTVLNRKVAKVTVGNVVHYFLRIPEYGVDGQSGYMELVNNQRPIAPVDDPLNPYANRNAFKTVLAAIYASEVSGIKTVKFHAQDPQSEQPDHPMHYATGQLVWDIVNAADSKWKTCAPQDYYYDYQRWLDEVNVDKPVVYDLQRYAWLRMSQAIYNTNSSVLFWSMHSENLGRTYIRRSVNTNAGPC
ncbi:hypothetical protein DYB34_012419 [Aphanomyces astaci]|uniref:Apple domain-containing protein n=1 Tax=Aphanomyces astaci TaxID=112090 RepID=A0A3R6Z9Q1_APHAT|nr:hypothetical protein DYB34_012419 [Aphanomyces astaci]